MPDTVGNQQLPYDANVVLEAAPSPGLKLLKTLVEECKSAIEQNVGEAWAVVSPGTPVVRRVFPHPPSKGSFSSEHLPALYAWPEKVFDRKRVSTEITTKKIQCVVLWVMPPSLEIVEQQRRAFWVLADDAMSFLVNPLGASLDISSAEWGTTLKNKLGAWSLAMEEGVESDVEVGTGQEKKEYTAYAWRFIVETAMKFDWLKGPVAPASGSIEVNNGDLPIVKTPCAGCDDC